MHKENEKWDKCPSVECFIVSKLCSLQWLFTTYTLKKSTQGIGLCYSPGGYSQSSDHTKVARETGFPPCTSLSLVSIIPPIRHILSANIWGTNRGQSFAQHYQNKRSTKTVEVYPAGEEIFCLWEPECNYQVHRTRHWAIFRNSLILSTHSDTKILINPFHCYTSFCQGLSLIHSFISHSTDLIQMWN